MHAQHLALTFVLAACGASVPSADPPDAGAPLDDAARVDASSLDGGPPPAIDAATLDAYADDVVELDAGLDTGRPDVGPRDSGADAQAPDDLEGFLDFHMARGGIRGLAAAITTPDRVALTIVRGEASEGVPVMDDTLFTIGSISKTFVAVTLMQLVEEGLLDLDRPVDEYPLGYPVRHPDHPSMGITARMLLTHTSGLYDDFLDLARTIVNGDPTVSTAGFAQGYVADPAHWSSTPGTRYSYCNAAYGVLGHLAEVVSSQSFRDRTEAELLVTLDLDGAGWFLSDIDTTRLATPYTWSPFTGQYFATPQQGQAYYMAGTLRMSVIGMARWVRMVARGGELDGTRVLTAQSVADMLDIPFPSIASDRAHGWEYDRLWGRSFYGHSGAVNGGSARILIDEMGVGIVVLTNSDLYVRARVGQDQGVRSLGFILERLDLEADMIARQ